MEWKDLHIRHKIRIIISLCCFFIAILLVPSDWFDAVLLFIVAFGLLGTSVLLIVQSEGK
jgi:uncharacterized membrane protein